MLLKKLSLRNYRNYDEFIFKTEHQVNLLVGPNAQGKTNLLEAIYVLAITKSHRTHHDKELIQWQQEAASLSCEIERKYGPCKLQLTIGGKGKKAKINNLEQRKLSDYVGTLNVVMFAPEDLEIVKGSPGVRRRFLDMEIGQVYPSYLYDLMQYQKVLAQRNQYLKQTGHYKAADETMLGIWNEQLIQFGVKIMKKRQSFIKKLQSWAERIHSSITNGREQLVIAYQPAFEIAADEDDAIVSERFMVKLEQAKEQEFRRGATLTGPHRDDMTFWINEKEAYQFGSQGQQRTTALSLKLAELELIHEEAGEYPILLLDDVLSELDHHRQTQLIETFQHKVQTFITTTSVESINLDKLQDVAIFHVKSGEIVRNKE